MNNERIKPGNIGRIISLAVILSLVFLLTYIGTATYRFIISRKTSNSSDRGCLSYLRNQVKNHDTENAVEIRMDGKVLVLLEFDGEYTYELRIYEYDGELMEEYVPAGKETDPGKATKLTETDTFHAEFITPRLLKVTTGEGSAFIRLFAGEVLNE